MPRSAPDRRLLAAMLVALAFSAPRVSQACAITETDIDHNGTTDLRLVGSAGKQNAVVELHQVGYVAKIDCNGNGSYSDAGDIVKSGSAVIETYDFELGGGDVISVLQTEDLSGVTKNILAVFGGGGNKLTVLSQGFGILAQSSLGIEVAGGPGADNATVDLSGSTVDNSWVLVRGDLAGGNDVAKLIGAAQATGSVIEADFYLGTGANNAAYSDGGGSLSASSLAFYLEGGDLAKEKDTLDATFAGRIEDNSRVNLRGNLLSGDDRFTANFDMARFAMDASAPSGSEAYIRMKGTRGIDAMTVTDGNTLGPATLNGLLSIDLDGGNQTDYLTLSLRGLAGSGRVRYRADGGVGRDVLAATVATDATSTNDLDIVIGGGPENDLGSPPGDKLTLSLTDNGAASYNFGGAAILDGGLDGLDRCDFSGNGLRQTMGCETGTR